METERHMRYLSQSIRLREAKSPGLAKATMTAVSLSILAFVAWSAVTSVHEIARTPGEVVPSGRERVVQHLEGGTVRAILVRDGDAVKAGDILLKLDGTDTREDLARATDRAVVLSLREEKLRAVIAGRAPKFGNAREDLIAEAKADFTSMDSAQSRERKVAEEQIRGKAREREALAAQLRAARNNAALSADYYQRAAELNRLGYLSSVKLIEARQQHVTQQGQAESLQSQIAAADASLSEYRSRLDSLSADQTDNARQQLAAVMADQSANTNEIKKLQDRVARLDVRAPAAGTVKGLAVNTLGEVVRPGQTLLDIVPQDETLVVALKIPPKYAGHIQAGQTVQVKFSSFDFARYGSVPGTIDSLSAATFEGENGERFYQGRVSLSRAYVGHNSRDKVLPGMTVMADIITGDKTILQYLLKPIQTAINSSFSER